MGNALAIKESPLYDRLVVPEFDAETGIELSYNEKVDKLYLFLISQPQVPDTTVHRITPGLYSREVTMPTGTFLISKTHKQEHQFLMSRGIIHMVDESGEVVKLSGHNHGTTKPGTRRVVYVEEEVVFTTFHPTSKTNLVEIEAELYAEDELAASNHPDHVDYLQAVKDMGLTPEQVRIYSEVNNVVPAPELQGSVALSLSIISGKGVFAVRDFAIGELIGRASVGPRHRTILGRYVNHSPNHNALSMSDDSGILSIYAAKPIKAGDEILLDYRQSFREAIASYPLRKQLN